MANLLSWIARFVDFCYWYCTDFMVNLANLTGTSYHEANTWILLVLIPGLLTLLIGIRITQWLQLRRLAGSFRSSSPIPKT